MPMTAHRDYRAFKRWAAEFGHEWPAELQRLAGLAELALKQMLQPRAAQMPKLLADCQSDIENFTAAYAAHVASKGA